MELYTYRIVSVDRIVDGDTVDLTIDLGFCTTVKWRFRMDGYDAPEIWRPITKAEYDGAVLVTKELESLLKNSELYLKSSKYPEIYARWGATIFYKDSRGDLVSINDLMIKFINDGNLTKSDLRAIPDK